MNNRRLIYELKGQSISSKNMDTINTNLNELLKSINNVKDLGRMSNLSGGFFLFGGGDVWTFKKKSSKT